MQGREQSLRISSEPPGATATFQNQSLATPKEVTIPRKSTGELVRVRKEGFYTTCRFVEWQSDPLLVTLDAIPAAIPLLIDLAFGAFPGENKDVSVALEPIPPGYVDVLPNNEEILAARTRGIDLCNPSPEALAWMRLKSRFGERAKRVIARTDDVTDNHEVLGQVAVSADGMNFWTFNMWRVGGFGSFFFQKFQRKESQAGLNDMLKLRALEEFGEQVDAVVNIEYEELPGYDMSATGIAVRLLETGDSRPTQARLAELEAMRKRGAITRVEYERKRIEILRGL